MKCSNSLGDRQPGYIFISFENDRFIQQRGLAHQKAHLRLPLVNKLNYVHSARIAFQYCRKENSNWKQEV